MAEQKGNKTPKGARRQQVRAMSRKEFRDSCAHLPHDLEMFAFAMDGQCHGENLVVYLEKEVGGSAKPACISGTVVLEFQPNPTLPGKTVAFVVGSDFSPIPANREIFMPLHWLLGKEYSTPLVGPSARHQQEMWFALSTTCAEQIASYRNYVASIEGLVEVAPKIEMISATVPVEDDFLVAAAVKLNTSFLVQSPKRWQGSGVFYTETAKKGLGYAYFRRELIAGAVKVTLLRVSGEVHPLAEVSQAAKAAGRSIQVDIAEVTKVTGEVRQIDELPVERQARAVVSDHLRQELAKIGFRAKEKCKAA